MPTLGSLLPDDRNIQGGQMTDAPAVQSREASPASMDAVWIDAETAEPRPEESPHAHD